MKGKILKEFKQRCKEQGVSVKLVEYINPLYLRCLVKSKLAGDFDATVAINDDRFTISSSDCVSHLVTVWRDDRGVIQ